MSHFKQYLRENVRFWQTRRAGGSSPEKWILADAATSNAVVLDSTLRIAMGLAEVERARVVAVLAGSGTDEQRRIAASFVGVKAVSCVYLMFRGVVACPGAILSCFRRIRSGRVLVRLGFGGVRIGAYIYDHLLRRHRLPTLIALDLKLRLEVVAEIAFFLGVRRMFQTHPPCWAVLADNTYRQGLTHALLAHCGIKSISGINLNEMSAHIYGKREDYYAHCRAPDRWLVERYARCDAAQAAAQRALANRTSGNEAQHDVVRAYGAGRRLLSAQALRDSLKAGVGKKLVVVMAHILQDAPHAYPGMLFDDYAQWLLFTCRRLKRNPHIVVAVKEHPSVELYREEGVLNRLLADLIDDRFTITRSISTASFLTASDAIVTCGGTCGIEFPCFGIPVVVAARPPYSAFDHIICPTDRAAYYQALDNIHRLDRLSPQQVRVALAIYYVVNVLMKVNKRPLGLGSQGFRLDIALNEDLYWSEMIHGMRSDEQQQRMCRYIETVIRGSLTNFIEPAFLPEVVAEAPARASARQES